MTNHFHLLIERQSETIGKMMQRVLTGYSQYYNRKYRKVGHVFQGRHKAIFCQSDKYLAELVRYIHLNPVRAKMVRKAENYAFSSHRAYLGMEPVGPVDVDPVLRLFGARKAKATENFAQFVAAGARLGHQDEFYLTGKDGILGTEEFIDDTIHRLGDLDGKKKRTEIDPQEFDAERLILAVEKTCQLPRTDFFGPGKSDKLLQAKEALIVCGLRAGATLSMLSKLMGLDTSTVSRRHDAAVRKMREEGELTKITDQVVSLL